MCLIDVKNVCLRALPSVESILSNEMSKKGRLAHCPRWILVEGIRKVLDQKRQWILLETDSEKLKGFKISVKSLLDDVEDYFYQLSFSSLGKVINGTGIIIHTNLGRAILAREVVEELSTVAGNYSNLEFDLLSGKRGKRGAFRPRFQRDDARHPASP